MNNVYDKTEILSIANNLNIVLHNDENGENMVKELLNIIKEKTIEYYENYELLNKAIEELNRMKRTETITPDLLKKAKSAILQMRLNTKRCSKELKNIEKKSNGIIKIKGYPCNVEWDENNKYR